MWKSLLSHVMWLKCKKNGNWSIIFYNVKDFETNYIMVQKWHPFEQDLCSLCLHFYFMFHLMVSLDVSWRVYNNRCAFNGLIQNYIDYRYFLKWGCCPVFSMPSRFKKAVFCFCKTLGFFRDEWNWMKHWHILKCLGKSWKIRTQSGHRVSFCEILWPIHHFRGWDELYATALPSPRRSIVWKHPPEIWVYDSPSSKAGMLHCPHCLRWQLHFHHSAKTLY